MTSFTKREKIFVIISLVLLNIWVTLAFLIAIENQELRYSLTIWFSIIQIIIASQMNLNCKDDDISISNRDNSNINNSNIENSNIDNSITETPNEQVESV